LADTEVENAETFSFTLANPTNGAVLGTASHTITINNVAIAQVLQFSSATATVAENAGSVTLTVQRTGSTTGAASVSFATTNGTATAGTDYTAVSGGTISFADGASSGTATITILDDAVAESSENFTVTLSSPVGASLGATSVATVTITDDDSSNPNCPAPVAGTLIYSTTTNDNYAASNIHKMFNSPGTALNTKVIANTTKAYQFINQLPSKTSGQIALSTGSLATGFSDVTITQCPGQFSGTGVNANCYFRGKSAAAIPWTASGATACPILPNVTYYFNVKPSVAGNATGFVGSNQ
jgi:hypothetical protein